MPPTDPPPGHDPPLVEGVDYVVERGLVVFTAAYLRRRGFCCGNGCRHCPYPRPPASADGVVRPRES